MSDAFTKGDKVKALRLLSTMYAVVAEGTVGVVQDYTHEKSAAPILVRFDKVYFWCDPGDIAHVFDTEGKSND